MQNGKKQIEELAEDIKLNRQITPNPKEHPDHQLARLLIKDGYRKAEWISVKDRLPNKDELVLCVGAKGGMFLGNYLYLCMDGKSAHALVPNSRSGRYALYWMPLPEAPKMKGE